MKPGTIVLIQSVSLKLVASVLAFVIALTFFSFSLHEAFLRNEERFDARAFRFFDDNFPRSLYPATRIFTFFGKPDFLIPLYILLLGYFLLWGKKKYAIEFGVLGATGTGLLFALKAVFRRNRPNLPVFEHLPGFSFPSGHALLSFILCSFLIYWLWNGRSSVLWKWTGTILLLLFSLCQGISRIILRVHFATDVIAGFCLGFAWIYIALFLSKKAEDLFYRNKNQPANADP